MNDVRRTFIMQSGFTLLELLVAIMILTLFMTASMGAVRIASRSWAAGHERSDLTEEMRSVSDFLRRQFAQLPALTVGSGNDERIAFEAGERELRFVAPGPRFSHGAGLVLYTLKAENVDGKESLTLRYAPFDPGTDVFSKSVRSDGMILAWGFEDVSFEYYGAEMDKDIPEWRSRWSADAEHYPLVVRIRTRNTPDGYGWPDLVYRLTSGERT
jgi:prepilin-type N-terminal cleavage/methylation domain-containing protein